MSLPGAMEALASASRMAASSVARSICGGGCALWPLPLVERPRLFLSFERSRFIQTVRHKRVRRGAKLKGQNFDGGTSRPLGIPPQRHAGSSGEGGGLGAQAARAQRGDGPTGSAGGLYLGVGEAALR